MWHYSVSVLKKSFKEQVPRFQGYSSSKCLCMWDVGLERASWGGTGCTREPMGKLREGGAGSYGCSGEHSVDEGECRWRGQPARGAVQ